MNQTLASFTTSLLAFSSLNNWTFLRLSPKMKNGLYLTKVTILNGFSGYIIQCHLVAFLWMQDELRPAVYK